MTGLGLGPQAMLVTTVTVYFGGSSSQRWLLFHTLLALSYKDVSAELVPCPRTVVHSPQLIHSAEHLQYGSLPAQSC